MESSRPAVGTDIARIAELAAVREAEARVHKGGPLWTAREALPRPFEESYRALLGRDDAMLVVGTVADAVVGFGAVVVEELRTGERLGVVTDLFVEPEARAVGVGEAMMAGLVAFCNAAGCAGMDTFALPGDRDAKNFLERSGFSARGLVMHKRLAKGPR